MKNYKRLLQEEGLQQQQAKALLAYMQQRNLKRAIIAEEKRRREEALCFNKEANAYSNGKKWALNTVDFIAYSLERNLSFETEYYAISEFVREGRGWPELGVLVYALYRLRKAIDHNETRNKIDALTEHALLQCAISIENAPNE